MPGIKDKHDVDGFIFLYIAQFDDTSLNKMLMNYRNKSWLYLSLYDTILRFDGIWMLLIELKVLIELLRECNIFVLK